MENGTVRSDQGGKMQEKETLDERLPALFEPDTLLPIQYFEAMRRKHLLEGEKRLILSVLEDAVECFMKCIDSPTNKGQRLFREAEEWINLEDKHWVFSFDNVCEMLDIHPEYMRRGLRGWKGRKIEAMARAAEAAAMAPVQPEPQPRDRARKARAAGPARQGQRQGKICGRARARSQAPQARRGVAPCGPAQGPRLTHRSSRRRKTSAANQRSIGRSRRP